MDKGWLFEDKVDGVVFKLQEKEPEKRDRLMIFRRRGMICRGDGNQVVNTTIRYFLKESRV